MPDDALWFDENLANPYSGNVHGVRPFSPSGCRPIPPTCCLPGGSMRLTLFIIGCLFVCVALTGADPKQDARFAKWEKDIAALESKLADKPPPENSILFAGSSTIRRWDVAKSFPQMNVVNVGFGGSEIRDSTHFADRIILKHKPRLIVFYAGDNDINSKRTPEMVLADYQGFVHKVHQSSPKTRILFLGIKPSPKRATLFETQKKANSLIEAWCGKDERLIFMDTVSLMLDSEGKHRVDLFDKDDLHLSPKGYDVWTAKLKPLLKE
jgi:lysophospholipase L1-like esterase